MRNEKTKIIDVDISVSLSSHRKVKVPIDFDETDKVALEQMVQEKIIMPQDYAEIYEDYSWIIDELCVL